MKAILVNSDKSLSWSEVPNPVVGEDDVLVEIHCAALNRADLMQSKWARAQSKSPTGRSAMLSVHCSAAAATRSMSR